MTDCDCGYSGDYWMCINGVVYGPCEYPDCGGVCLAARNCDHECHTAPPPGLEPADHPNAEDAS